MMKTSFTYYLKKRWRILPLLFFSLFSLTQIQAACDKKISDATLTLDCEGNLSINVPGVTALKISGTVIGSPNAQTPYYNVYNASLGHATNTFAANDTFWLAITCVGSGSSPSEIVVEGIFPNYNIIAGLGAGTYTYNMNGSIKTGPTSVPKAGALTITASAKKPSCPTGNNGSIAAAVSANLAAIVDKCEGAKILLKLDSAATTLRTVKIGLNANHVFANLYQGTYKVTASIDTATCPCLFNTIAPESVVVPVSAGATVSMACVDQSNLTVDETCMASIDVASIFLSGNDACDGPITPDSLVIKYGNVVVGSGSGLPPGSIGFDAAPYIGQNVTVEVHHKASGNYCWGTIKLEDKTPPKITCDEPTIVNCFNLTSIEDYINGDFLTENVQDCSQPVTYLGAAPRPVQIDIDPCANDSAYAKAFQITYRVQDALGNKSPESCTETIYITRVTRRDGPEKLGFRKGYNLIWPSNFVVNATGTDSLPLECSDPNIKYITTPQDCYTEPIQVNRGGTGWPVIRYKDDKNRNRIQPLIPLSYAKLSASERATANRLLANCGLIVTFTDSPIIHFQCKKKFIRTWTIQEWDPCANEELVATYQQTITIADHEAPFFTSTVPDKRLTVLADKCVAPYIVPNPGYNDLCDQYENLELNVSMYDQDWDFIGSLGQNNPNLSFEFPIGESHIIYTIRDGCGNARMDTTDITVVDETPPLVVCVDELVVGISGRNAIRVPVGSFDRGTTDGCQLDHICVVRMDDWDLLRSLPTDSDGDVLYSRFAAELAACDRDFSQYSFKKADGKYYINEHTICTPYVSFCCEDADQGPIMVRFTAKDVSGNKATVMVQVTLQDKVPPSITPPGDVKILCSSINLEQKTLEPFKGKWLKVSKSAALNEDPLAQEFGYIVPQEDVMRIGAVLSGIALNEGDPLDGVLSYNCVIPMIETRISGSIDKCGSGMVTREFRIMGTTRIVRQTIMPRALLAEDYDIRWPNPDTLINGCLDPDQLVEESFGTPVLRNPVACSDVYFSFNDEVYRFNTSTEDVRACFKIVRTWTAIDWCRKANGLGLEIAGPYKQVIKVSDPNGPTITCARDTMVMVQSCEGTTLTFMPSATDECTAAKDRIWKATIYINGSFDKTVNLTSNTTNSVTLSYFFPIGTHSVDYSVRDRCGNETVCTQRVTVVPVKKPTPVSVNLSTALMPTGGMVTIWASDFERSSSHPCGEEFYDDLEFFIGKTKDFTTATKSLTYTCAQANSAGATNNDSITVYFFAAYRDTFGTTKSDFNNEAQARYFNQYAKSSLRISDNDGNCNYVAGAFIAGNIHTESNDNIPNIAVDLRGGNQGASAIESSMTDQIGDYAFPAMSVGGKYVVDPESDDNYLNGVSTLDLVLIQRYILGLYDIESAYKLIAADVNNDGAITGLDLVDLRSTILGFKSSFTNNDSWRFIDANYTFEDATNPFDESFKESYAIDELQENMVIDFIGLKVGDVNGSVSAASVVAKARSTYKMFIDDKAIDKGTNTSITLKAGAAESLIGTQFTIEFDAKQLAYTGIKAEELNINSQHINAERAHEGILTISWNDVDAINLNKGDALMTLNFNVLANVLVSDVINLSSTVATAEAYNDNLETKNVQLTFNEESVADGFELYQNSPNPFADYTTITFNLPSATRATITIGDVTGKVIKVISNDYKKGLNSIKLHKSDITDAGLLYYTLESAGYSATKRMVVLK